MRLSPDEARRRLVHHLGLDGGWDLRGADGTRELLGRLRMIQLDPLDPLATNADLVAMARVRGIRPGDVHRHNADGASFEHWAKQRCLLPAAAFPWYRDASRTVGWWRTDDRRARVPEGVLAEVEAEVAERGPIALSDLTVRGRVQAIDWSGWKGTARATTMALEVLWTSCRVVVVGRDANGGRIYDVPERTLAAVAGRPAGDWGAWAIPERARAAGMLPTVTGPWWGALRAARKDGSVDRAVQRGDIVRTGVEGSSRTWLTPPSFLQGAPPEPDDRLRILGPLDPVLWDRTLVGLAFGFEYVWEVYKPASKRRWGWYVSPLLRGGRLVGRLDARVDSKTDALIVRRVWWEGRAHPAALRRALRRHASACGVTDLQWLPGANGA